MAVSLRLNENEMFLVKSYAKMHGLTTSELFRQAVIEKIENDLDLQAYEKAIEDFNKDPVTYTQEEVEKELGLV